mmetsp:Transcript_24318/g.69350  ORF Transcript_24318/g.69350 Transcript_24318/m.69350 type:complete len:206 (+) Transcript_24318:510-1127(+)
MLLGEADLQLRVVQGHPPLHGLHVRHGRPPVDHLVQDDAQGPDVGGAPELQPVGALLDGLRRHVAQGADGAVPADVRGVAGDLLGDAEVDDLQAAPDQEEVPGLEVGVHDALRVYDLDGFQHLPPEALDVLQRQARLRAQERVQVRLAGLHDDADPAPRGVHLGIDDLDDLLVVPQLAQQDDLVLEGLHLLGVVRGDPLQGQVLA